jgi:hypothetical protein
MTALSIRNDTWIDPPPPKAENPPKQKTLERIAKQNRDPDGDILKLELLGKSYSEYRARLMSRNPFCVYCGQKLKEATATLDHIYPHSRGGLNAPGNLFLACGRRQRGQERPGVVAVDLCRLPHDGADRRTGRTGTG